MYTCGIMDLIQCVYYRKKNDKQAPNKMEGNSTTKLKGSETYLTNQENPFFPW